MIYVRDKIGVWKKIKTVILDFDDTLINRPKNVYSVFKKMIKENVDEDDTMMKQAMLQDCMIWDQRGS